MGSSVNLFRMRGLRLRPNLVMKISHFSIRNSLSNVTVFHTAHLEWHYFSEIINQSVLKKTLSPNLLSLD